LEFTRILNLFDVVFAIVMTLLVLNIDKLLDLLASSIR
jgi:uncharacterized membrane protein